MKNYVELLLYAVFFKATKIDPIGGDRMQATHIRFKRSNKKISRFLCVYYRISLWLVFYRRLFVVSIESISTAYCSNVCNGVASHWSRRWLDEPVCSSIKTNAKKKRENIVVCSKRSYYLEFSFLSFLTNCKFYRGRLRYFYDSFILITVIYKFRPNCLHLKFLLACMFFLRFPKPCAIRQNKFFSMVRYKSLTIQLKPAR